MPIVVNQLVVNLINCYREKLYNYTTPNNCRPTQCYIQIYIVGSTMSYNDTRKSCFVTSCSVIECNTVFNNRPWRYVTIFCLGFSVSFALYVWLVLNWMMWVSSYNFLNMFLFEMYTQPRLTLIRTFFFSHLFSKQIFCFNQTSQKYF